MSVEGCVPKMHVPGRSGWQTRIDLPDDVNFVFWLRRRVVWLHRGDDPPPSFPESAWCLWLQEVVRNRPVYGDRLVELAPDPELKTRCAQQWPGFLADWKQMKRGLVRGLMDTWKRVRVQGIMDGTNLNLQFLHTVAPGDFAWPIGSVWVLGAVYLQDAAALRDLLTRLRDR